MARTSIFVNLQLLEQIDRNFDFWSITFHAPVKGQPGELHHNTILDCELVEDVVNNVVLLSYGWSFPLMNQKQSVFYIFDVIAERGESVIERKLDERLQIGMKAFMILLYRFAQQFCSLFMLERRTRRLTTVRRNSSNPYRSDDCD